MSDGNDRRASALSVVSGVVGTVVAALIVGWLANVEAAKTDIQERTVRLEERITELQRRVERLEAGR